MIVECVGVKIVSPKLAIAYCVRKKLLEDNGKQYGYRTLEVLVPVEGMSDALVLDFVDEGLYVRYDSKTKKYWFRGEARK